MSVNINFNDKFVGNHKTITYNHVMLGHSQEDDDVVLMADFRTEYVGFDFDGYVLRPENVICFLLDGSTINGTSLVDIERVLKSQAYTVTIVTRRYRDVGNGRMKSQYERASYAIIRAHAMMTDVTLGDTEVAMSLARKLEATKQFFVTRVSNSK